MEFIETIMAHMETLLSSWIFVGGITGSIVLLSILIGYLLARAKIKKGFDVYED